MSINNENLKKAVGLNEKGIKYLRDNSFEQAKDCFLEALKLSNEQQFGNNLGIAYIQLGDIDKAIEIFSKLVTEHPNSADAHNNLGNVYTQAKDYDKAIRNFEKAIIIDKNFQKAYNNLAIVYQKNHNNQKALELLLIAEKLSPKDMLTLNNIGKLYKYLNDYTKAKGYFLKVLTYDSNYIDSKYNLADIMREENNIDESLKLLNEITNTYPTHFDANYSIGLIYKQQNRHLEAITYFVRSLNPNDPSLLKFGQLAECYLATGQWREKDKIVNIIYQLLSKNEEYEPLSPFHGQMLFENQELQLKISKQWAKKILQKKIQKPFKQINYNHKKLKIGYISCDLANHPVALLLADLLSYHDREQFEIYIFSTKHFASQEYKNILKTADHTFELSNNTPFEIAKCINDNEIDILVDLTGATNGDNFNVLTLKPASVACHILGYTGTLGLEAVDYFMTNEVVIPKNESHYLIEKPMYLPDTEFATKRVEMPDKLPSRNEYNLPEDKIVFIAHHSYYRIEPEVLNAWFSILHSAQNSVLWILCYNETLQSNIIALAENSNIEPNRLIFYKEGNLNINWQLRLADIWLDPFIFSSGTCCFFCFNACVPMITLKGNTPQARVSAGYAIASGFNELVANTKSEYIQKAIFYATNKNQLNLLKNRMKTKLTIDANSSKSSKLFNQKLFIKNLENCFKNMHKQKFKTNI